MSRADEYVPPKIQRMPRESINDIFAFLAVAQDHSFTRAAARLGISQSALSHTVRSLETRLGVRLLTRTTRSVSPTEAGERLIENVQPRLEEIEQELIAVSDLGDKPAGTIRITAIDHVIDSVLWPRLAPVLEKYPDVRVATIALSISRRSDSILACAMATRSRRTWLPCGSRPMCA